MFIDMMFLSFKLCQIGVLELELFSGLYEQVVGHYGVCILLNTNVATAAKGT